MDDEQWNWPSKEALRIFLDVIQEHGDVSRHCFFPTFLKAWEKAVPPEKS